MPNNQAKELLTIAMKEAQHLSKLHWDLVTACRLNYPQESRFARMREQEHLEHAAYYEDRARSCEKALLDITAMEEWRNTISKLRDGSRTADESNSIVWECFDEDMIPDLPIQTNYLISNGRDIWVGQLDYGPHDTIKWYVGEQIITDITHMAFIHTPNT